MAPPILSPPPTSSPGIVVPQNLTPPQSFLLRSQRFLEDNWVPILIGCGVLSLAGVGYYYNLQNEGRDGEQGSSGGFAGNEKKEKRVKGKKKKGGRRSSEQGTESPLLEEVSQDVSCTSS